MTIDQWLSASLDVISFLGFVVVIIQLRDSNRQTKLETQIRLYDINRELIALGFSKPELFGILNDAENVDPIAERRYLQLWLNLLSLIFTFQETGGFRRDYQECCEHDVRDMVAMQNMRRHWQKYGIYYPASFRNWVNDILDDAGQEETGAKRESAKS